MCVRPPNNDGGREKPYFDHNLYEGIWNYRSKRYDHHHHYHELVQSYWPWIKQASALDFSGWNEFNETPTTMIKMQKIHTVNQTLYLVDCIPHIFRRKSHTAYLFPHNFQLDGRENMRWKWCDCKWTSAVQTQTTCLASNQNWIHFYWMQIDQTHDFPSNFLSVAHTNRNNPRYSYANNFSGYSTLKTKCTIGIVKINHHILLDLVSQTEWNFSLNFVNLFFVCVFLIKWNSIESFKFVSIR